MRKLVTWIKAWTQNHMSGGKPPPRPPPWNSGADNGMWAKAALLSGPPGGDEKSELITIFFINIQCFS